MSEMTPEFIGAGGASSEPSVFTEYIPSIGNLFELNTLAGFADLEQEEPSAEDRAAPQGERSGGEHIALLARVLRALRRL
jgi:hypothetical protein